MRHGSAPTPGSGRVAAMSAVDPKKKRMAEYLLPECPYLLIDGTLPEVELPPMLKRNMLVLRIGRDPQFMGMPDLVIDDKGWRATLMVQGFRCWADVPWSAVKRMWPEDGPIVVWPDAEPEPAVQLTQDPVAPKEPENKQGLHLVKT